MIQIDEQIFQLGCVSPGYFEILKHRVHMYIHIFRYMYIHVYIYIYHIHIHVYVFNILVNFWEVTQKKHKKAGSSNFILQ